MIHPSTSRQLGGLSAGAMGRRPYLQTHRRPPPLPRPAVDDRNPVSSSVPSPFCSREEKDSSLPRPRLLHTTATRTTTTPSRHQIRNRPRLYHSPSSDRAPTITHRTAALAMIQRRPLLQAHSHLARHIKSIMALLQPLLNTATALSSTSTTTMTTTTSPRLDALIIPHALTARPARLPLPDRIPRGAWDSHMHVVDPAAYPLSSDAVYKPRTHRLDRALAFESSVGIDNIVLVQPSIYGTDNACLLDALRALGPDRGRGVVAFEPGSVSPEVLREWHALGVRGVRLNLSSAGKSLGAGELEALLRRYAEDCAPLDWVIQLYVPMEAMDMLERVVPLLGGVRVCVDHLGHPSLGDMTKTTRGGRGDPYEIRGFPALARMLGRGATYVKLSAPYRLSCAADHADLEPVAREILRLRGRDRVVFATDWPHTRFEGLDIRPWMETVLGWCGGDDGLVDRLFRGNAEDLWNGRLG